MTDKKILEMPNKSDRVFSTKEDDYKAICFFDLVFSLNQCTNEKFGFHVPVVKEGDGLFYALCLEVNQVAYASTLDKSVSRMGDLISFFAVEFLDKRSSWESFYSDQMDLIYYEIFHRLKRKVNINKASMLDKFRKGDDNVRINSKLTKIERYEIQGQLGMVTISKKYEIAV